MTHTITGTMTDIGAGRATAALCLIRASRDVAEIASFLGVGEVSPGTTRGDLDRAFVAGREHAHRQHRQVEPVDVAQYLSVVLAQKRHCFERVRSALRDAITTAETTPTLGFHRPALSRDGTRRNVGTRTTLHPHLQPNPARSVPVLAYTCPAETAGHRPHHLERTGPTA